MGESTLKAFLFIIIGLAIGIFVPHLQNISNAMLSGNQEGLMNELLVTWQPALILIPIIATILFILHRLEKKGEQRKATKRAKEHSELMDKIRGVIQEELKKLAAGKKKEND